MPSNPESASPARPLRFGPEINPESSRSLQVPPPSVTANPLKAAPPAPDHEIPAYDFLGYLPESYGTQKLFLVPRDPHVLFAYWDLSPFQYQEAARVAKDGKLFLEIYVPGEGRIAQIHVWDNHKNWYLQANRPDTDFVAQLGYYTADGGFTVLARSAQVHTPRDTLSPNVDAKFVTIPFGTTFRDIKEIIAAQSQPGEELLDTLARLEEEHFPLPFEADIPPELTAEESEGLLEYVGNDEVRRRMVGSLEITEILRKRYETTLSSVEWTSSAGASWMNSSRSSPFGASFGRGFHLHLNAELIIYGGTEPTARVRIDGKDISLSKDGTFSYHFVFPDGQFHIPVEATSHDQVEKRSALLSFLRMTAHEGDVRQTAQPKLDEPLGRLGLNEV